MRDSGELFVFVLVPGSSPIREFVSGVPAELALAEEPSAPTLMTVLAPLRFDAITLFPAYYLQRELENAAPKVTLAAGLALHDVARMDGGRCSADIGFGQGPEDRARGVDGGEILGRYAPDLELSSVDVPCDALGGAGDGAPLLASEAVEEDAGAPDDDVDRSLQLTPIRDEAGWEHYEATSFQLFEKPTEMSARVSIEGNQEGTELLACAPATLLDESATWKKIRLVLEGKVMLEGWVQASLFEPGHGSENCEEHGYLGGAHHAGPPPTFCAGTLAAGTRIFSRGGTPWATVPAAVEGAFDARRSERRLVNFFGEYQDAFCRPGAELRDSQGIAECVEDAWVRPEDVTLRCPAGKKE